MSRLEGTQLGCYSLQSLLGRGGMSEVYRAQDEQWGREVAIKVVHESQTDHLERFRREVETLEGLTHDHILPIYDHGQDGSWHYLVMPYVTGGTLQERLQTQGPLTQREAGCLLEQVASALQYAHEHCILHRDIKSSNILLRDPQYVYLADFGVSKSMQEAGGITRTGCVIGTVEYLAPELSEQSASPSSEVYALGILLYEMLTGHVPFRGSSALAIYLKHLQEIPVRPSLLNPTLARSVELVVLRALAKEQSHRFATPQALAQAYLEAFQTVDSSATKPILLYNAAAITKASPTLLRSIFERFLPCFGGRGRLLVPMALVLLLIAIGLLFPGYFVFEGTSNASVHTSGISRPVHTSITTLQDASTITRSGTPLAVPTSTQQKTPINTSKRVPVAPPSSHKKKGKERTRGDGGD